MSKSGDVSLLVKWHNLAQRKRDEQLKSGEARAKVELERQAADFQRELRRWQCEDDSVFSDNNHVERVLGKPTSIEARSKVPLKQQATTFGQLLGNTDFKQKLMRWQGEGVSVFSDENHVARVFG